ncbi:hypothetical protein FBG13_09925 [Cobetia marina]|uniref:hypothetical protein n=1 Tax=Cobetia marina TaxID=28258 RepID=UPI0010AEB4F6|nr:hypothetical protein [Cobetia marina]TKD63208.1 hypothetical protein FBG13_09925 [Cobetia marina]
MNRISRKLIVSGLLTALALPMTAMAASGVKQQEQHDGAAGRQAGLDKILASWHLSDAQKQKLETLKQQQMESRKQLKEQTFDSREARRDAIKAQRDQHKAALAEILDDNQVKVLEAYWAAGKPMHGKHDAKRPDGAGKHGDKPMAMKDKPAGGKHMGRDGDQRMALMGALFDSWNLDDDQRASLKDSFDAMRDDMKSLKETAFDSREARKAAFKELRETQHERLAKVLNDDQIKVLDMMHQRDKRGPKMAEHQQREGMKALLASWNLSDDQMQALKEVRKEMRDEMHDSMKEMHDDMRDAMKDADTRQERVAARQEMRKEMKEQRLELRQEGREKLAVVLSAEQLDALEAFMANGMRHGGPHGGPQEGSGEPAPQA